MRNKNGWLLLSVIFLTAVSCLGFNKKLVFQPETEQTAVAAAGPESGRIIDAQSAAVPEWVKACINGDSRQPETLAAYRDRYIFIGKNRGTNLSALRHWADNFSGILDFPRLAAERIEERMVSSALLYPDDEYGEYFEVLIKNAADAEYPPALKEASFWIKRQFEYVSALPADADSSIDGDTETENESAFAESQDIYEFFVLLSIDKITLQTRIRQLLAEVKTAVPPTRAQSTAINRVGQNFFEGF